MDFDELVEQRRREASAFYQAITPSGVGEDAANVMRQALAGMLWSKQYFLFDVDKWIDEHGGTPPRNREWFHMIADDVISMPDKWEYPWFAAWDLAFHTIALSSVDPDFAKQQLDLLMDQVYLHPTGTDTGLRVEFQRCEPAGPSLGCDLHLSHGTGTARQDRPRFPQGRLRQAHIEFRLVGQPQGSLRAQLCLRAASSAWTTSACSIAARRLPTGGYLEQADGTGWVALFCQNMAEIAFELAAHDRTYERLASNYMIEFLLIARAMNGIGADGLWDEQDGFYYDMLRQPDGRLDPPQGALPGGSPADVRRDNRGEVAA